MAIFSNGQFIAHGQEAESALKSGFGRKNGDELLLHPLEAAYMLNLSLIEIKRVKKNLSIAEVLSQFKIKTGKGISKLPSAKEQFEIYSQIRSGGRIIRFNSHSPQYWRVYARGVGREQERAQVLLRLMTPSWETSIESLNREISVARQLRMELVLAFFEKGAPAFVKVNKFTLD